MKKLLLLVLVLAFGLASAENYAKYIVICADALYNSIQPLAQWRHASGLPTRVVKLSEVGSDTTAIRNFVRDAYYSGPVRPEYLLLVGSGAMVPARLYYSQGRVYVSTDNNYGDVNGDTWTDIAVGRLPASSAAQLDVMVAKTLRYERTPDLTDSLWMRRLTTIVREGGDSDDTLYWNNVRNAAQKAAAAGFVGCDSLSYYRGHSAVDIASSCNRGTGLVLYRGTASGDWYTPFDRIRPSQITATNKLSIITSITCETMTLTPYEEMIGDSWMRAGTLANLRGAVAFFGNTHSASEVARLRGAVARGFYDGLFAEGVYRLGWTVVRARRQLKLEFPTYVSDYRGFGLLGDPALAVWTATPSLLDVQHPKFIQPGQQQFTVTVTHNLLPVQDALVCASMSPSVYVCGYTNSEGQAVLDVNPPGTGSLRLVVTGQNLCPYDTIIPVVSTAASEQKLTAPEGSTMLSVSPNPCRSSARVNLSPFALRHAPLALWVYNSSGRLVQSAICNLKSEIALNLSGQRAGVYHAVLRSPSGLPAAEAKFLKLE